MKTKSGSPRLCQEEREGLLEIDDKHRQGIQAFLGPKQLTNGWIRVHRRAGVDMYASWRLKTEM